MENLLGRDDREKGGLPIVSMIIHSEYGWLNKGKALKVGDVAVSNQLPTREVLIVVTDWFSTFLKGKTKSGLALVVIRENLM